MQIGAEMTTEKNATFWFMDAIKIFIDDIVNGFDFKTCWINR